MTRPYSGAARYLAEQINSNYETGRYKRAFVFQVRLLLSAVHCLPPDHLEVRRRDEC
jgi:hypothetical protein